MLEKGIILKGRVADIDGKPLPNVWVNAEITGGPAAKSMPLTVGDHLMRSALSDSKGGFVMRPLPAGEYAVVMADHARGGLVEDETRHPLPAVFLNRKVTLDQSEPTKSIEVRAVPYVTVKGRYVDSSGTPTMGCRPDLCSNPTWFTDAEMDDNGGFVAKAPKGLRVSLRFINSSEVRRTRIAKDAPLQGGSSVDLGILEKDMTEITVVR